MRLVGLCFWAACRQRRTSMTVTVDESYSLVSCRTSYQSVNYDFCLPSSDASFSSKLGAITKPMIVCAIHHQGRSDGGYIGIYTLPKSGQVNFLWSNNNVSTYYVLWNAMSIKILYLSKTDFWLRPCSSSLSSSSSTAAAASSSLFSSCCCCYQCWKCKCNRSFND